MTDAPEHEIVWRHDQDHVTGEAVCHADPTAQCRWRSDCDCEVWYDLGRDDNSPFHVVEELDPITGNPTGQNVKHRMTDGGTCNVLDFLNADPSCLPELRVVDNRGAIEIGRTPIKPFWDGDSYFWKVVA
jgi:hypothetical protein